MLCQNCSKNVANTQVKSMINGEYKEYMLCSDCAKKLGYMGTFGSFESGIDNFFGSLFGQIESNEPKIGLERCNVCGASFDEIVKTGKVGCASCYQNFYEKLKPSIQRIHGNTHHIGKLSRSVGSEVRLKNEIDNLKKELNLAIKNQEFEEAAKLRDKIKELENRGDNND